MKKNELKKLSIITICYNEPNVEATCESIVNQTWQDFEWIVIDGGSNGETQKVWNKYKYRIDKFVSEPDNGRYNAMNKGIKLATSEYLIFLNSGDALFYDNVLKDVFKDNEYKEDVLYGHEQIGDNSPNTALFITPMPQVLTKAFLYKSTLRHQASFIKRSLFDEFGLYNEQNQVVSDYEKWFEFLEGNASFKYLPYIISAFNTDGISSNKKSRKLALAERESVLNQYFTKNEIALLKKKINYNNILERIFSIKNNQYKTQKIITILWIRIKIRRSV